MTDKICESCERPLGRIDDELLSRIVLGDWTHEDLCGIFGVSRVAITRRIKKLALEKSDMTVKEFKKGKLDHLYNLAFHAYQSMTPSEIRKASLNQKVVLFGTIFDKIEKLENRGVPEISFVGVKHIHELGGDANELLDKLIEERNAKRIADRRMAIGQTSTDQLGDSSVRD